jgi:hypothetical protein
MAIEPDFTKIKDGFYLINSPQIRENPWYLTRKPGQGTYAEVANDIEIGVYVAPWPYNKRVAVEEHQNPELRMMWDAFDVAEVIRWAYDEIITQLAEGKDRPST